MRSDDVEISDEEVVGGDEGRSNQELRLKELPRPRERRKGGSAVNW